ncbi:type II secretion system F family protein [Glutamicibacter ardleyensis]|uniref:type II secretion system F family protein n=1 Tax=Glutamicibacter ardleyensis TaxID=225894 RepID=UPI003FD14019
MTATVEEPKTKRKPLITFTRGKRADPDTLARSLRALSLQLSLSTSEHSALRSVGEDFKKYDIGHKYIKASDDMFQNGITLTDALAGIETLPLISRKLIASSQTSSQLYGNIRSASNMVSDAKGVKKRIVSALIPSAFNLAMTLAFLFVAVNFIIPKMIEAFSNFHAETPATTIALLAIAGVLKWVVIAITAGSLLFALWWTAFGRRSERFRTIMDRVLIRVPFIGEILMYSAVSRLFSNLALNLRAGLSEIEALESSASGCGNDAIRAVCTKHTKVMLSEGALFKGFVDSKVFPLSARQLVLASATSHQAIELFEGYAPEYQEESRRMMDSFSKTLEPTVGAFTQIAMGVIILMVMFPIFSIYPAILNIGGM